MHPAAALLGTVAVLLTIVVVAVAMIRYDRAERDRLADERLHDRALRAELDRYGDRPETPGEHSSKGFHHA